MHICAHNVMHFIARGSLSTLPSLALARSLGRGPGGSGKGVMSRLLNYSRTSCTATAHELYASPVSYALTSYSLICWPPVLGWWKGREG